VADTFERRREEVIDYLALTMVDASNSRAAKLAASYCRGNNIPATNTDIADVANEAIRRRTSTDITTVDSSVSDLSESDTLEQHLVAVATSYTIDSGYQLIVYGDYDVVGDLTINGTLVIL
jgi:hypothetical protein